MNPSGLFLRLWLGVDRRGRGLEPFMLLTSEVAHSPKLACSIVLVYACRWEFKMALRFDKCELTFESLRLRA